MICSVKPYKCRPLSELLIVDRRDWTKDELSAFNKFKGNELHNFVEEWETVCTLLNKDRSVHNG